ncbi:hypothetical protein LTR08_003656 [Meristemomyces frigidus]|nr:hypothetical protein LTR08_003656 [Meristemomyces frigidus]
MVTSLIQCEKLCHTSFTWLKVPVLAEEIVLYIQIAAFATVRSGNPFATSANAQAIIAAMIATTKDLNNQMRRLEVLTEQLWVRSVASMRKTGDERRCTDEMSEFALHIADDAVAIFAHVQRLYEDGTERVSHLILRQTSI